MRSVYLAGPDVFLSTALDVAKAKIAVCSAAGLEGMHPFDNEIEVDGDPVEAAQAIYRANVGLMDQADLCIANLTPFRGPNVDDGTAFEVGYMIAQGKPVFGYDNSGLAYADKVAAFRDAQSDPFEAVEPFGLTSNLMLAIGIVESGGIVVSAPEACAPDNLQAFSACVDAVAEFVARQVALTG